MLYITTIWSPEQVRLEQANNKEIFRTIYSYTSQLPRSEIHCNIKTSWNDLCKKIVGRKNIDIEQSFHVTSKWRDIGPRMFETLRLKAIGKLNIYHEKLALRSFKKLRHRPHLDSHYSRVQTFLPPFTIFLFNWKIYFYPLPFCEAQKSWKKCVGWNKKEILMVAVASVVLNSFLSTYHVLDNGIENEKICNKGPFSRAGMG